jgi:hypothetical protein
MTTPKYRIVTVQSSHNAAAYRKLQKSGFNCRFLKLFVTLMVKNVTDCDHFVTLIKVVTMKTVMESFKSPSLAGFFVISCYYRVVIIRPRFFLYFTSVLNSQ